MVVIGHETSYTRPFRFSHPMLKKLGVARLNHPPLLSTVQRFTNKGVGGESSNSCVVCVVNVLGKLCMGNSQQAQSGSSRAAAVV